MEPWLVVCCRLRIFFVPTMGARFLRKMTSNNIVKQTGEAGEQLDLLSSADMPDAVFEDSETGGFNRPEFTGERLLKNDPDKYKMIVSLRAEGLGILKVAKLLKVSPNTVTAVSRREGSTIDIEKKELADICRSGARLCAEAIVEKLNSDAHRDKANVRDLAITAGVLVEKSQLLSGGATARIESQPSEPDHEDFNAFFENMQRVEPISTGCMPETPQQKESLVAACVEHKMLGQGPVVPERDSTTSCDPASAVPGEAADQADDLPDDATKGAESD